MNTETQQKMFRIGAVLALVVFAVMLIDHFANDGGLLGVLGVVFLIVALFLVILLFITPRDDEVVDDAEQNEEPTPETDGDTDAYYDYKGDVHKVIDVEGIGEKYAQALQEIGIHTTARLCYEDADEIAKKLDVHAKTVRKWQAMSQLAKVNGIGKQYAEALVRAGVDSIDELKNGDPDKIAAEVKAYLDSLDATVLGQNVTQKRVAGWQKKAKPMRRVRQTVPEA